MYIFYIDSRKFDISL